MSSVKAGIQISMVKDKVHNFLMCKACHVRTQRELYHQHAYEPACPFFCSFYWKASTKLHLHCQKTCIKPEAPSQTMQQQSEAESNLLCLHPGQKTNYQLPNGLIKVRRRWGQRQKSCSARKVAAHAATRCFAISTNTLGDWVTTRLQHASCPTCNNPQVDSHAAS
jgi:hypothetical protein